jgi:DNA-binding NarL/FixJ family response regulator
MEQQSSGLSPYRELAFVPRATRKTVLLIAGDSVESGLISEMILQQRTKRFELYHVDSVAEAEGCLARQDVDVILLDMRSGGTRQKEEARQDVDVILLDMGSGGTRQKEEARQVRRAAPRVSIVLLLSPDGESAAKQAMQDGAQDYLIKGEVEAKELVRVLENAMERKTIEEALFEEKERAQVTLDAIGAAVSRQGEMSS